MKVQALTITFMMTLLAACGTERPNPEDYRRSQTGSVAGATKTADSKKTETKTASNEAPPSTMTPVAPPVEETKPATATPPPAATPPAPVARVVANATELANARTQYDGVCAVCHGVLATSAKKGRTAAMIIAARTIPPHANVQNYPNDIKTTVGQELLNATAMAEVLK